MSVIDKHKNDSVLTARTRQLYFNGKPADYVTHYYLDDSWKLGEYEKNLITKSCNNKSFYSNTKQISIGFGFDRENGGIKAEFGDHIQRDYFDDGSLKYYSRVQYYDNAIQEDKITYKNEIINTAFGPHLYLEESYKYYSYDDRRVQKSGIIEIYDYDNNQNPLKFEKKIWSQGEYVTTELHTYNYSEEGYLKTIEYSYLDEEKEYKEFFDYNDSNELIKSIFCEDTNGTLDTIYYHIYERKDDGIATKYFTRDIYNDSLLLLKEHFYFENKLTGNRTLYVDKIEYNPALHLTDILDTLIMYECRDMILYQVSYLKNNGIWDINSYIKREYSEEFESYTLMEKWNGKSGNKAIYKYLKHGTNVERTSYDGYSTVDSIFHDGLVWVQSVDQKYKYKIINGELVQVERMFWENYRSPGLHSFARYNNKGWPIGFELYYTEDDVAEDGIDGWYLGQKRIYEYETGDSGSYKEYYLFEPDPFDTLMYKEFEYSDDDQLLEYYSYKRDNANSNYYITHSNKFSYYNNLPNKPLKFKSLTNYSSQSYNDTTQSRRFYYDYAVGNFNELCDWNISKDSLITDSDLLQTAKLKGNSVDYIWSDSTQSVLSITDKLITKSPGWYFVEAENEYCFIRDSLKVYQNTILSITGDTLISPGKNTLINAELDTDEDAKYYWFDNDSIEIKQGKQVQLSIGNYKVIGISNFFVGSNEFAISRITDLGGIMERIKIYPNPTKNEFVIEHEGNRIKKLVLYDQQGTPLYTSSAIGDKYVVVPDNLPNGVYILKISLDSSVLSQKIIINH